MEVGLVQLLWESMKLGSTAHPPAMPLYPDFLPTTNTTEHNTVYNRLNN